MRVFVCELRLMRYFHLVQWISRMTQLPAWEGEGMKRKQHNKKSQSGNLPGAVNLCHAGAATSQRPFVMCGDTFVRDNKSPQWVQRADTPGQITYITVMREGQTTGDDDMKQLPHSWLSNNVMGAQEARQQAQNETGNGTVHLDIRQSGMFSIMNCWKSFCCSAWTSPAAKHVWLLQPFRGDDGPSVLLHGS